MNRYINPYRLFQGCIVPNWLLRRIEISSTAKLAYGRLIQYAGKDGLAYPSYATMARELAVSSRQAIRLIGELTQAGLLAAVSRERGDGGATSNAYQFVDHIWMHESEPSDTSDTIPVPSQTQAPLSLVSPKENHSEENPLKHNISFDHFYSKYPRHVAKAAAERAWKTLHPNEELQKVILADIDRRIRIDWANRAKELWPHPATYLNGKRWQDEPEQPVDPYAHRNSFWDERPSGPPPDAPFLPK